MRCNANSCPRLPPQKDRKLTSENCVLQVSLVPRLDLFMITLMICCMSALRAKRLSQEPSSTLPCGPMPALVPREAPAPRPAGTTHFLLGLVCKGLLASHHAGMVEQRAITRVIHCVHRQDRAEQASCERELWLPCHPDTGADRAIASLSYCPSKRRELSVSSVHLGVQVRILPRLGIDCDGRWRTRITVRARTERDRQHWGSPTSWKVTAA